MAGFRVGGRSLPVPRQIRLILVPPHDPDDFQGTLTADLDGEFPSP
jgi:hypothetical protein